MLPKEILIKKPSAMIQTNVKELTLTQRKIINCLIHVAQKKGDQKKYMVSISNLKKLCNINSKGNDDVKEQLKKFMGINIEFNYLEKERVCWEINTLLSGARFDSATGIVEFAFSPFIQERILKPSIYSPLNIYLIAGFKSSYTVILYEFLRDYLTSPKIPLITIDQFRTLMGIDENRYRNFKYLKRDVLSIAVNEINDKTDLKCFYKLTSKLGRKYTHIQFSVNFKEDFKTANVLENDVPIENLEDCLINKNIDDDIYLALLEEHRTLNIANLVFKYLNKGKDYIISNIKYVYSRDDVSNFSAYLKTALENNYGEELRLKEVSQLKEEIKIAQKNKVLLKKILVQLKSKKSRPSLSRGGGTLTAEDIDIENLKALLEKEAMEKKIDLRILIEQKLTNIFPVGKK